MGEMAQKISKLDKEVLLNELNIAFAEEWLSYYQYWIGTQIAVGSMRHAVVSEFIDHAHQELEHAEKLAIRIVQLGGVPLTNPKQWEEKAQCKYAEPENTCIVNLVRQNLISERCAINRYQKICDMTFGKDYDTFRLAAEILHQELDHEQDMEDFEADFAMAMNKKQ